MDRTEGSTERREGPLFFISPRKVEVQSQYSIIQASDPSKEFDVYPYRSISFPSFS